MTGHKWDRELRARDGQVVCAKISSHYLPASGGKGATLFYCETADSCPVPNGAVVSPH